MRVNEGAGYIRKGERKMEVWKLAERKGSADKKKERKVEERGNQKKETAEVKNIEMEEIN